MSSGRKINLDHKKRRQMAYEAANSYTMAIRVMEFSNLGYKLERFLPNNQHTQRKLLNFENWINREV